MTLGLGTRILGGGYPDVHGYRSICQVFWGYPDWDYV